MSKTQIMKCKLPLECCHTCFHKGRILYETIEVSVSTNMVECRKNAPTRVDKGSGFAKALENIRCGDYKALNGGARKVEFA